MFNATKAQVFYNFYDLLITQESRMGAQEQYEELLKIADDFGAKGM